ncbi:FAD-dependent oxidoreductase [Adlercreutzia equolifaciens]|uniref:FAD-dependent oxidoreductase n=1 Tax=Adlercreutzia equolifaciens TaxID=446660 RepID=UPI0022DEA29E|nr:FAD-dependent oxidoreductase [Adlercreutzia equolifaciens]
MEQNSLQQVSRRNFMKGALVAGAATAAMGLAACSPNSPSDTGNLADTGSASSVDWDQEADIVIVGGGTGGSCAALAAAEAGASVIVIEANSSIGGSGALCGGAILGAGTKMQADQGIEDNGDALLRDTQASLEAMYGPDIVEHIGEDWCITELHCAEAAATVDWLVDHGVDIVGPSQQPGQPVARLHMLYPNASAWPSVIQPQLEEAGVDLKFNTKAAELIVENGRVVGVKTEGASGACYKANKGVIVAAGSIEASKEWRRKIYTYAQSNVEASNKFNDGSGIRMMCKVGADTSEYTIMAAAPALFCTAGNASHWYDLLMNQMGAILVDSQGKRFANEETPSGDMTLIVDALPDRQAFLVYDAAIAETPEMSTEPKLTIRGSGYGPFSELEGQEGKVFFGDTIEEAAEAAGVDPAGLAAEIEKYNASAAAGSDPDFGRTNFGISTSGLIKPPYRIIGPVYATVMSGAFGVRVTDKLEVLDTLGEVIPGLYATGEGAHGLAKDMLTGAGGKFSWALTSGRLAGTYLASL